MFRILITFVLTVFLFVGLIGTANIFFRSNYSSDQKGIVQLSEKKDTKLSIKEIESLTASNNLYFTAGNSLK